MKEYNGYKLKKGEEFYKDSLGRVYVIADLSVKE